MKVFFTASQRGKKQFGKNYKRIYEVLVKLGYQVIEDDLLKIDTQDFYDKLDEGGRDTFVEFYKQELKYLQDADINIFECSLHSLSIGFIIQKSLDFNKPTIVLYEDEKVPQFLTGIEEEKLMIHKYNLEDIEPTLKEILDKATNLREKRFNFFISPDLLTYLQEASKKDGVTMSVFLRNLLLQHRKKHDR